MPVLTPLQGRVTTAGIAMFRLRVHGEEVTVYIKHGWEPGDGLDHGAPGKRDTMWLRDLGLNAGDVITVRACPNNGGSTAYYRTVMSEVIAATLTKE